MNKSGKEAMDAAMGEKMWENAGISGDRTQHLLWRLREGNYNVAKPDVAVITIGINNLNAGDCLHLNAEGYKVWSQKLAQLID